PGFRPAHAKGAMLSGTFTPSASAGSLTRAPHLNRPETPVTVRFSGSTGFPNLPDNDANADPRGIAIRFHLAEHSHTDIIAHAADGFPARTGEEFLELLKAAGMSDPKKPSDPKNPSPIEKFLAAHPATLAFVKMPKPTPSSFARATYFSVNAMKFTNSQGASRFARYRIVPVAGNDFLEPGTTSGRSADFLFEELKQRIGREPIEFKLVAQIANDGDVVNDATVRWPADRAVIELGKITLTAPVANNAS